VSSHALCLLVVASTSIAATHLVPAEFSTIQAAVDASIDGDTVLVSPGTYTGKVDYLGKAIVLRSVSGASVTTLHVSSPCGPAVVIIRDAEGNGPAVLDGFTISSDSTSSGVYCENSDVVITSNDLTENYAYPGCGAGIQCVSCSVILQDNHVFHNYMGGGAALQGCSGIVANNEFVENESGMASSGWNGLGGALNVSGIGDTLTIRNNLFLRNSCASYYGYPYEAPGLGGAIRTSQITGRVLIVNDTFSGNRACFGGAIHACPGVHVINCILWDDASTSSEPGHGHEIYGPAVLSYSDVEQYANPDYVFDGVLGDGMISDTPMFVTGAYSAFELDELLSPCVDAGCTAPDCYDFEDPGDPGQALYPALGTILNDMGAYGGGGVGYWVGIAGDPAIPVGGVSLSVFPNPCSSSFLIVFELSEPRTVDLRVYDVSGRRIGSVVAGEMPAGRRTAAVDDSGLLPGVYFCCLEAGEDTAVARIVLIR